MKKYVIFAGVNGAGKSTLFNTLKLKNTLPRVNSEAFRRIAIYKGGKLCLLSRNVPGWFSKVIESADNSKN